MEKKARLKLNKSKYINPKNCLRCGTCCKTFSILYLKKYEREEPVLFSEVQRFRDLDTDKITITEEADRFIVTFNYRCKHLVEKNGTFRCAIYTKNRPELCRQYPYEQSTDCPHKEERY